MLGRHDENEATNISHFSFELILKHNFMSRPKKRPTYKICFLKFYKWKNVKMLNDWTYKTQQINAKKKLIKIHATHTTHFILNSLYKYHKNLTKLTNKN